MRYRVPGALHHMGRRRLCAIVAGALVVLLALLVGLFLKHQQTYVSAYDVSTVNMERSQVYVTGSGYRIDKKQKSDHEKVERERKKERKKKEADSKRNNRAVRSTPTRSSWNRARNNQRSNTGKPSRKPSGNQGTGSEEKKPSSGQEDKPPSGVDPDDVTKPGEDDNGKTEEEKNRLPEIKTSIVSGSEVKGTRYTFWVTVTDYKGNNVPVFSVGEGKFTVTCNGESLTSTGENGKKTSFRAELREGRNEFRISAEDSEGRKKTLDRWVTCNANEEAEKIGTVSVKIKAPILGLGTLYSTEVEIEDGDSVKDALKAAFDKGGYTGVFSGSYLAGIKKHNIAKNASISDSTRAEMEERRKTEKDPDKQDKDSLKEHDFYDSSGWLYSVNGDFPNVGTGSFRLEDGDEVEVIFALDNGVY